MTDTENKKSATERLNDLESAMAQIIQAIQPFEMMARDVINTKETIKLLNNKLDALVKAVNQGGPITDEVLSKFMVENNVKELADKVTQMVAQGLLTASDTVTKDSFVVINEADSTGAVVNPRMQFLLSALQHEEVRTKLDGSKVGDNIKVGDQGASINVLESYNIVTPQAQEIAPAQSDSAEYGSYESPAASDTSQTPASDASQASAADSTPAATG